jgi:FtsH-binding integral membrane protein
MPDAGYSALTELVFASAWAAMAQTGVVIVSFLAFVFGSDLQVMPAHSSWTGVVAFCLAMFVCFYALLEFSGVVRTLLQLASAIVDEEGGNED